MKKFFRSQMVVMLMASMLCMVYVNAAAMQFGTKAVTVVSVDKIEKTVETGTSVTLPKTVTAKMSNGKKQDVIVIWNSKKIDTKKQGKKTITGKLKGYGNKVTLILNVVDGNELIFEMQETKLTVEKDQKNLELPEKVLAYMWDGSTKMVSVKWNNKQINTSEVGTRTYEGTVEKYNCKTKLTVTVEPAKPKISDLEAYTPDGWQTPAMAIVEKDTTEPCDNITTADEVYINYSFINKGPSVTAIMPQITIYLDNVQVSTTEYNSTVEADEPVMLTNLPIGKLKLGEHKILIKLNSMLETNMDKFSKNNESNMSNNDYSFTINVKQAELLETEYYKNESGKYKLRIPAQWEISETPTDSLDKSLVSQALMSEIKGVAMDKAMMILCSKANGLVIDDSTISTIVSNVKQTMLTATNKVVEASRQKISIAGKDAYMIELDCETSNGVTSDKIKYIIFLTVQNDLYYVGVGAALAEDTETIEAIKQSYLSFLPEN